MALKKVESSKSTGSIPFFDEWKKEQSPEYIDFIVDQYIEPKQIKAVTSGKGFMLNFGDAFSLFLWKNSTEGKVIKTAIREESSSYFCIQFSKTKKGELSYDFCIDEETEVTLTEDKYDEGLYYMELTTGTKPPIAPNDHRRSLLDLPEVDPRPPVRFTPTKPAKSSK